MTPGEWIAALREAAALARSEAGQAEVRAVIAGRTLRIRVAPTEIQTLLSPLAAGTGSAANGSTIELWEGTACGVPPPELPPEALRAGRMGALDWLSSPTTAGLWHDGGPVLFAWDAAERTVTGWIGNTAKLPAWQRAAPLRAPLNWVLRGPGRTLVHAAAVGRAGGGNGLLIGGPGGSGKSTTALSWLLAGGDFAGENDVLLDLNGPGGPTAAPVYANAKVDARTMKLVPELRAAAGPTEEELGGKAVVDLRALRPGQPTGPIPLAAVVIPRVAGRDLPEVKPISSAAALRALAPSSLLQLPDERAGLTVMAALLRGLPCFEIELSADPAANVSALDEALPA